MISEEEFGIYIDSGELPVLLQALIEAKFSPTANDRGIVASPILSSMLQRALSAMLKRLENQGGHEIEAYRDWLNFEKHIDFWSVAVQYAQSIYTPKWLGWSDSERLSNIENLISPFYITEEGYKRLLAEMNLQDDLAE